MWVGATSLRSVLAASEAFVKVLSNEASWFFSLPKNLNIWPIEFN